VNQRKHLSPADSGDWRPEFWRRFVILVAYLAVLTLAGTLAFLQFPEFNLSDAWYMTVITITAVGYEEIHPLNTAGRLVASVLLVGGITAMGLSFALITAAFIEMDLAHVFRNRRTMKKISKVKDHIILCGAGRTGRQVIRELVASNSPYVVIELDPDRGELVRDIDKNALVIEADATNDQSLIAAEIGRARGLLAALSSDTDNLFVCLSARDLQPNLTIVARAYNDETTQKLFKAGADHVVSPNIIGGTRMASVLLRPHVVSFLDVVTRGGDLSLNLEEVEVPRQSPLEGQTLAEAAIRDKTGLIVIAVRREADGSLVYNPGPGETIRSGDYLIVLGRPEQTTRLSQTLAS
jgi:voltage-gated potassium channel